MDIADLTSEMDQFVDAKGWYRRDSPRQQTARNLAIALSVECGEVLELFEWDRQPEPGALAGELADVLLYLLQIARICEIELETAVLDKLETNYRRDWPDS